MAPADVKAIRQARRHTLQEAADCAGVHLRTWQRWEAGEVPPDLARLELYELKHPAVVTDEDSPGAHREGA